MKLELDHAPLRFPAIDPIGDRVALAEAARFPAAFASAEPPCTDSLGTSKRPGWKEGSLAYKITRICPVP